jgi:hypothetical protein
MTVESVPSDRAPQEAGRAGKGDHRTCDVFARRFASYGLHRSCLALRIDAGGELQLTALRLLFWLCLNVLALGVKVPAGLPETRFRESDHAAGVVAGFVIEEPRGSHGRFEVEQVRILDALDRFKGVFERIKKIVVTDHFDIGPAEAPKLADFGKLLLGILRRAIKQNVPVRPAVFLKFELPAPFAALRHQTGVPHFLEEVTKPVLD